MKKASADLLIQYLNYGSGIKLCSYHTSGNAFVLHVMIMCNMEGLIMCLIPKKIVKT
jgi:hypothetical protein